MTFLVHIQEKKVQFSKQNKTGGLREGQRPRLLSTVPCKVLRPRLGKAALRAPSRKQQRWKWAGRAHARPRGLLGTQEPRSRGNFVRHRSGDGSDARCQAAVARRCAACFAQDSVC